MNGPDGAIRIPPGPVPSRTDERPKGRPIVAYCGHGERSASGISILERAGFEKLLNLDGGFGVWEKAGYVLEQAQTI